MAKKPPQDQRSARWFAPDDLRSFGHRSRMMQLGYAEEDFRDKPLIGVLNTWSELNTCHAHFRERAQDVKRGVAQAGGFAVEMPSLSVDESFTKPTSMLFRNMLAMETEEMIRSHPLDGVVLMGGCDKTTPGLVMGAISAGVPMIYLPPGPMLRGNYAGKILGSGSDAWRYWDERRAGNISDQEWLGVQGGIARSAGTCMTMGTASTMTAIADAMGLTLPGASSIPAVDSNHLRMAASCGRRIVDMVWEDLTPDQIVTDGACRNAAIVAMATGCSTNAVVHLIAMARRAGGNLGLDDLDELGRITPLIANVRPSGQDHLMEDFFYAGGLRALMKQIEDRLDCSCMTVTGKTLGENLKGASVYNDDVIRPLSNPVYDEGSLAVPRGNLCPDGAVIKPAACDPKFHVHEGPALVFDDYPMMKAAVDDEDLDITPDTVMVLRNADHPQRVAIETCPPGQVLVMDGRKDASAASAGSILVTRLAVRGGAGIVSDAGFRDMQGIGELDMPAYCAGPSAPTNLTKHEALDINVPIACGDVAVFPGDVMVGDNDGVMVIPAHLADEIAEVCAGMESFEDFVLEEVKAGAPIIGLYPCTKDENKQKYDAWRAKTGG